MYVCVCVCVCVCYHGLQMFFCHYVSAHFPYSEITFIYTTLREVAMLRSSRDYTAIHQLYASDVPNKEIQDSCKLNVP
jgi:hypothetical protein